MAFLFGSKKAKSPAELVKATKDSLSLLEKKGGKGSDKANEAIAQNLSHIRHILMVDAQGQEQNQDMVNELYSEICSNDLVLLLIQNLGEFEFETKKDTVSIMNYLLRKQQGKKFPIVDYIQSNTTILDELVTGYEDPEIAVSCGAILRDCIRQDTLCKIVLNSDLFFNFFKYVELANFDSASDAFTTFKDLLTVQKAVAADFLEKNYDAVFESYTKLLTSANYVTRRQSLKLLGELLLDRANFSIMTRYIRDEENLKLMMRMLRDKSKNIQFEAFHVFKVFVANPNKAEPILTILIKNKQKLIAFLNNFHNDKEDEQFNDEKAYLLKQVQALPDP
eukprot:CAMPEP_0201522072 /NCGR_PEP_ID=MMETSP0161_2-20130828/16436_1 /ASSEMBLY_ACC=CAM_ASM_000251 /TAXON_ID=180227 /ORGANISM="Neoparamoeba aestuarina, Strain SoJaBio B1-5/56/2" /LENGTH=335 /DNA_ID=CAMNT_0047920827 /DNA_START=156 /DNA_END=1163 /DNA_ORIENTATION=-